MRIAFYAPLKAPDHPVPSGDRTIARLLIAALKRGGAAVEVASRIRTPDFRAGRGRAAGGDGEERRTRRPSALIAKLPRPAEARTARRPGSPITSTTRRWTGSGRSVAAALGHPLFHRRGEPHAEAGGRALCLQPCSGARRRSRAADGIFCLNPIDRRDAWRRWSAKARLDQPAAFPRPSPISPKRLPERARRAKLARAHGIDADEPWLLAIGMMRKGDKLASYQHAWPRRLRHLDRPWQLLIVGDGEARAEVERAFKPVAGRRVPAGRPAAREAAGDRRRLRPLRLACRQRGLRHGAAGSAGLRAAGGGGRPGVAFRRSSSTARPAGSPSPAMPLPSAADLDFALDADLAAIGQGGARQCASPSTTSRAPRGILIDHHQASRSRNERRRAAGRDPPRADRMESGAAPARPHRHRTQRRTASPRPRAGAPMPAWATYRVLASPLKRAQETARLLFPKQ